MTATAALEDVVSISSSLHMNEPIVLRGTIKREQMRYSVVPVPSQLSCRRETMLALISSLCSGGRRGLVFCSSIKRTEALAAELSAALDDVVVTAYHAKLADEDRKVREVEWKSNQIQVRSGLARALSPPVRSVS